MPAGASVRTSKQSSTACARDLAAADEGARQADLLAAERTELDRLASAAEAERTALADRQLAQRAAQAAAIAEITRLEEMVARAKGAFDSVASASPTARRGARVRPRSWPRVPRWRNAGARTMRRSAT
jgi:DNA-binding protein H-NS